MRIGLVSDTHVPEVEKQLPVELLEAFRGVDYILHAGDIYAISVLDELEKIAPVLAAAGDDDYGDTLKDSRVKEKHTIRLGDFNIWLVHQKPYYLTTPWWHNRDPGHNDDDTPDIVIYGHEHHAVLEEVHNILFVNPGSPTFLHYKRGLGTVGMLDLKGGRPEAYIIILSQLGDC